MDNISQNLETESFSYRWLATEEQPAPKPNSSSIHNNEADHSSNFDFEITSTMSEFPLVHADKLFSNGVIKPQYLNTTPSKIHDNYDPPATATISSTSSSCIPSSSLGVNPKVVHSNNAGEFELQGIFPRKWRKLLPRKIVSKYLIRCFIPVNKSTTRGGRTRVDDVNRRTFEVHSSSTESTAASPRVRRQSCAWSDSDESSIHEAILYCKQSNGL